MNNVIEHIRQFPEKHILVIGDLIVDKYITGRVERVSPEAPIPIVIQEKVDYRPGGAANVALNLHELGVKCSLLTVMGNDDLARRAAEQLPFLLNKDEAFISDDSRITTCKTRVMAHLHHIVRIDEEDLTPVSDEITTEILHRVDLLHQATHIDAVILQDYEKGVFHEGNISTIIKHFKQMNVPVIVDPKDKNFWLFKDVTIFKPNKGETEKALGLKIELNETTLALVDSLLRDRLHHSITALTLSEQGIYLNNVIESLWLTSHKIEVLDVCGAGDAVISIIAAMYITGASLEEMATVSNIGGGIVCEISGVAPVKLEKLLIECEEKFIKLLT